MRPYGLVLAGGGAKGAYQIGAWKAMIELGIEFNAIAGTSIGAINGALIAQGDFDTAISLWNNAEVVNGINLESELKDSENLFSFSNFPQIFLEIIKNGGVDVTPAKQMISDNINEERVRESGIPLGMVTFQLTNMKPIELFVDEMPEGQLIDYLMASARFPGLNKQGPDDNHYLDGGIYDNAPIGVLRKRGINRLVVIDISNMKGIGHRTEWSCADIIYIRPYDPKELGEPFEFDREFTEKRMLMGYLDAKKAFGVVSGWIYCFNNKDFTKMINTYGYEACSQLEKLAVELEIPKLKVYTHRQFMKAVIAASNKRMDGLHQTAETITSIVPAILHETKQLVVHKITSYNKLVKNYPQAYRAIDMYLAAQSQK